MCGLYVFMFIVCMFVCSSTVYVFYSLPCLLRWQDSGRLSSSICLWYLRIGDHRHMPQTYVMCLMCLTLFEIISTEISFSVRDLRGFFSILTLYVANLLYRCWVICLKALFWLFIISLVSSANILFLSNLYTVYFLFFLYCILWGPQ